MADLQLFLIFLLVLGVDVKYEELVSLGEYAAVRDRFRSLTTAVINLLPRGRAHIVTHGLQVYTPARIVQTFVKVLTAKNIEILAGYYVSHVAAAWR